MIPIYDKYYTEDDIKQLTDFYQTPIGKKVISSTPLIIERTGIQLTVFPPFAAY